MGNQADAAAAARAGYALMGGGTDLDEAFVWLCERAGGGDFLVLRATGTDAYNPYIKKLCPKLNSVATLVIPNRAAAGDAEVARKIAEASGLFISGGDQANYINFWMGTPVQAAMNEAVARGIPLGGTSAGLAVMGEWAYSAQGDKPDDLDLTGKMAMADPVGPRVTLVHGFLRIPALNGVITDTHFVRRERMERLLVFLARLDEPDGKPVPPGARRYRGIGVDQEAAVLLDPDGAARVVGKGDVYFIDTRAATGKLAKGAQVAFGPFEVRRVAPGHAFNIATWSGDATTYTLSIQSGITYSTQAHGSTY
ncbi:MAG TPA: cyanophycinase [Terracidiphilus sp.]|nr:cyanophycinase [Terracidiphilus sp.]